MVLGFFILIILTINVNIIKINCNFDINGKFSKYIENEP